MTCKILFLMFFQLLTNSLFSQVKDTIKAKEKTNSIWSGSVALGGSYQSGNVNKSTYSGAGRIARADFTWETILVASYLYGTKNGAKDNNNLTSMLTIDYKYKREFSPFFLEIFEYNYAKGIDARSQTGGGAKYRFYSDKKKENVSSVSLALIYDYTNLYDDPRNYDTERMRFSLRLKTYNTILDSHLVLSAVAFFQPAVDNFSENNQLYDIKLSIPIVKKFKFIANYKYSKDDVVSVGRKRVDINLIFGLEYIFGKEN